jgi:hypothetical protein
MANLFWYYAVQFKNSESETKFESSNNLVFYIVISFTMLSIPSLNSKIDDKSSSFFDEISDNFKI